MKYLLLFGGLWAFLFILVIAFLKGAHIEEDEKGRPLYYNNGDKKNAKNNKCN